MLMSKLTLAQPLDILLSMHMISSTYEYSTIIFRVPRCAQRLSAENHMR